MIERQSYIKMGRMPVLWGKRCYLCRTMEEDFDIRRSSNSSAEREFENAFASAPVRGFQRTVEGGGKPESFRRGCQVQGRAPRPYFVARSSGIGEDHAEQHHSQRTGRGFQGHVRPGIGQAGRFGRYPDFAGAE